MDIFSFTVTFSLVIGILAGTITFLSHPLYMVSIVKGETKPHVLTWVPSAIIAGITLFLYEKVGGEDTIFAPLGDFVGLSIIALLTLWRGKKGSFVSIDVTDWLCAVIAMIGLGIYIILDSSLIGFGASMVAEVFALIPTMRKTISHPDQEDFLAWTLTFCGNALNFLAMNNMVEIVYVVVIFIADGTIWALILKGRMKKKKE